MKHLLISLLAVVLMGSCCPKITQLPPVVVRDTVIDSIYVPQPPIIIPADEFEIGYSLQELCDSTWRANHPQKKASGKRLQGTGTLTPDSLKFRCKEDEMQLQIDSLLKVVERITEKSSQKIIIEKCPSGWPKIAHPLAMVFALVGLIAVAAFGIRRI
jgi:hypothetical protein